MSPCALTDPPPGALAALDFPSSPSSAPPPTAVTDDVFLFPATPAQRRFWLLDGLQPGGNPALNFTLTLWLSGTLDRPALERALAEIGRRHESLRTTFRAERGHLRQVVAAEPPSSSAFVLPFHDVADYPVEEQDAVAPHFIGQEAKTPFPLRRGPLWRARLVRVAGTEHFLLLSVHHILCDGWTLAVLVRELGVLYDAFVRDQPSPLPPLPIQFPDYADWLAGHLADPAAFGPSLDYWRTHLAGQLRAVELPTDRPRPTAPDARRVFAEATEATLLPRDLAAGVRAFAAREGATVFMVYFTAFLALLHRLSGGKTDLVVVTPSANRGRPETERLVGLLANPLLLRVDAGGDPSARGLLGRVRAAAVGAFAHGELPFERIVEELRPDRLPVSFVHQGAYLQTAELVGGLRLTPLPGFSGGALYELLGAVVEEPGGGTRVVFEYNAELFDPETVRRWLGHYQTLLAGLLADPDGPVSVLPLLSPAERRQLGFDQGTGPTTATTAELPDLFALLSVRVAERADAPAAREGRRELPTAELLARLGALGPAADRETALFGLAGAIAAWRTGGTGAVVEMPPAFGSRALALADRLGLQPGEAFATLTPPTAAAAREEAAAALITGATLASPRRPTLGAEPTTVAAVAEWLEKERAVVACLPAAAWAALAAAATATPASFPARLRLALVTEDDAAELPDSHPPVNVVRRRLLPAAAANDGGTAALDGQPVAGVRLAVCRPGAAAREPQPVGVAGELWASLAGGEPFATGGTARRRGDGTFGWFVPRAEAALPVVPTVAAAPEAPWLTIHHQLIAIWEDVLGVRPIGLRDDFFALGGNSLLALRMLARVEEACGRVVLPATLFTRPTVAELAEEIAREETRAAPVIIPVRETGDRPPLFFLHGDLAGGGFYCQKLARLLGDEQPFYVLPPTNVLRLPPGLSIEEMAAGHLAVLRSVRPSGPYRLGGFCLGGLVAFELARQLSAAGETVENLVLIDAVPATRKSCLMRRVTDLLARRWKLDTNGQLRVFTRGYYLAARLRRWRGLPWREQASIVHRRLWWHHRLPSRAGLTVAPTPDGQCCDDALLLPPPTPEDENRGWDAGGAFLWAAAGYRPQPYAGRATLLLSTDLGGGHPENPTGRWRRLLPSGALEVRNLPGGHLACLTDHVAALGQAMREGLEK